MCLPLASPEMTDGDKVEPRADNEEGEGHSADKQEERALARPAPPNTTSPTRGNEW